ncbi:D-amino-acid transaminase [Limibaculum sp. FT325]|uniref:D-amino-acid transaminase n=1 Tax=Thermohalobaculum sediminis TaxID=2939436 RepID=UPI0020C0C564|nr:D-amino-acid transaminase [Limibaculum sediminis]MCL5778989.1 D-amino-acid transaminase [Limibaculum sediminis]
MPETVYLNGRFLHAAEAKVSVFDRGLLFADAIYEVCGVIDGKLIDFPGHMARLDRSLSEMGMTCPLDHDGILDVMRRLVAAEGVTEGLVYMQFTRGSSGDRDFLPSGEEAPTVFGFAQHKSEAFRAEIENGIHMVSAPDQRWRRRDIKTVGLMGSVFAKMAARDAGGQEALLHEDGIVTEGAATSFFFVRDGRLVTRPLSDSILHGCTRKALIALVAEHGLAVDERLFTLAEAKAAEEAFLTGASTYVCPVLSIDAATFGDGRPGSLTRRLQTIYVDLARESAI